MSIHHNNLLLTIGLLDIPGVTPVVDSEEVCVALDSSSA